MDKNQFRLVLTVALAVVIATFSTLQITSAWAATGPAPLASASKPPRPDVFHPAPANRAPIGKPGGPAIDKSGADAKEIVGLRTRTSMTLLARQGYELVTYPGSIHFQDASGAWRDIDNRLVTTHQPGYAYQNLANSYAAYFPTDIGSRPVDFKLGTASVAFVLVGANGRAVVSSNTVTYANVFPGVTVEYSAMNDALKETLSLQNADRSSFTYALLISPGLTARLGSLGSVDFVDGSGKTLFGFSPPFMVDAAGARSTAIQVQVVGAAGSQSLVLSADPTWLSDPRRAFPVVIDPTVTISYSGSSIVKTYAGANQDCYLDSSSPTSNFCGGSNLYVGYSSPAIDRSLLQFNVSIAQDANILEADLAMQLSSAQSTSPTSVSLYPVTSTWSTAASWNKRDSTNSWTTAGGDYSTPAAWTNSAVGPATGTYHWYLSSVVQGWITGTLANDGLILKADNETATNRLTFYSSEASQSSTWPYLKVIYQLGIGDLGWYRNVNQQLTDHLKLKENLSSGNLLGVLSLINLKGTGLNEVYDLNYNILSPNLWDFGRGWITNTGWDQYVDPNMGDGASFFGPTGFAFHYLKNGDGTYATPPGIDADLIHNGDGTWTIKAHSTGEKLNFTSNGLYMTSDVDRNGDAITFGYDANGALASITDAQGRVTTFSYVYGTYTTCTPPTASGFVQTITDPGGRTYSFTYDTNCDLTTYTDPNHKVTTFGYDSLFNLVQITDPLNNQTKLTYNGIYKVTSVTRVTNVSQGTGPTTTFTYNAGNTVVTDPNNNQSTFVYDTRDRVTQGTDSSGSVSTAYTGDNKHASDKDQNGNQASYSYNSNNNLTSVTPPLLATGHSAAATQINFQTPSSVAGYLYLPSSVTDPQGNCSALTYDSAGNQTDAYIGQAAPCDGQTGGAHLSIRYQGDPGVNCGAKTGEICSSTDTAGNVTAFGYDANGNLSSVTPPSPLGAETIAVDSLSRTTSITDGKGQKTSYSYDALDRVTQILYNGATTCTPSSGNCITFAYDADGNRTSMTDNTGTTSYYYDALNRTITLALPDTTSACAGSSPAGITLSYDSVGNVITYCDSGGTTTYGYDNAYDLVSLAEPGGSCGPTPSLCTTFGYDPDGHRTLTTFPGGATLNAAYDSSGNLTSLTGKDKNGSVLTSFAYTYNNGTHDTQLRQTLTEADAVANNTYGFVYDGQNRLTQANITAGSGTSYRYTYDANGNLTSRVAGSATTTLAYNAANELCWVYSGVSSNTCTSTPAGATTYSFDANGNETGNSSGASFTYNAKNQTSAITFGGTTLSPLTYSGTDQSNRVAAGASTFANGPGGGVQISSTGGASTYFERDSSGTLIGERIAGNHYYYLTDALNSVVAVISGDGLTVSDRYGYDPYGNRTSSSGTVVNPWGYAGGFTDSTGLLKFGARYYDPSTARWTQSDPLNQGRPLSTYRYAVDDPVNGTDPNGAWCCFGWNGVHWHWWGIDGSFWFYLSWWDVNAIAWFWPPAAAVIGGAVGALIGALIGGPIGAFIGAVLGGALGYILGQVLLWPMWEGSGFGQHGVWICVYWYKYWWGYPGAYYWVC